ncbi:hypothetical protein BDV11DRAFT_22413 [Aspergillus similis]
MVLTKINARRAQSLPSERRITLFRPHSPLRHQFQSMLAPLLKVTCPTPTCCITIFCSSARRRARTPSLRIAPWFSSHQSSRGGGIFAEDIVLKWGFTSRAKTLRWPGFDPSASSKGETRCCRISGNVSSRPFQCLYCLSLAQPVSGRSLLRAQEPEYPLWNRWSSCS